MRRLAVLAAILAIAACQSDRTGPDSSRVLPRLAAVAANDDGPPAAFNFGPDTYTMGVFTGTGRRGLTCSSTASGERACDGFLRSSVDKTLLDVQLQIPAGTGPFPLIALIHGYAGSKTSSGDIAGRLLGDGYAVLRYSTRGFGESWGQVNLADLHTEIGDLRSMIAQVVDESSYNLNPDAVAVAGASYGGGHSWLALVQPTFATPKKNTVRIRAIVPIAPWTDLFYSLVPNGRPNNSLDGIGGLKLSFVNGLYVSGIREDPARPYPNYPDYLVRWHALLNATEPDPNDPTWRQVEDGVGGGRSIWWQQAFWSGVAQNRVPVFQVQGFTDDLFPLPEAKRMLLALQTIVPDYPITTYFGDLGHPRARNQPAELDYVLGLIEPWLAFYLKGIGTPPTPTIYAARTDEPFNPSDVVQVSDWTQLSTGSITHEWPGSPTPLVNPVTFVGSGVPWDPFVDSDADPLKPYLATPPSSDVVPGDVFSYSFTPSTAITIAGQPTVSLDALVVGHRVQLDVRVIDVGAGSERLITRGTVTLDVGAGVDIGPREIEIPTYGNFWMVPAGHSLRLDITNVDSPYLTPSREPSSTTINSVALRIPIR
jgi:ABC-2 type transport system ATP-binding protein